eukprot:CAMPEP_0183308042 /NCGR_PEP_ID=MMETSP0160_2-20130417/19704_1 /TAXON_ID=2839 ORGANISM="Odontella Sinensis, Strain Grunow 1884" /NCGR_SAMPLE_ID=MMETSP0160_2 /ASSEMBLY_ACC=CAM_ASM_000250 /LENGTH=368 /DNA_ID=CAMNT_0025471785 /DNA_START=53 /DNA_END=1159 /DNA_ORIENTATION=+
MRSSVVARAVVGRLRGSATDASAAARPSPLAASGPSVSIAGNRHTRTLNEHAAVGGSGRRGLSSSSIFVPPPPNAYHGVPVYDPVDITAASSPSPESASARRNADPDAVHVVTGASRSMGLQFVKSLLDRTEGRILALCRDPSEGGSTKLRQYLSTLSDDESKRVEALKCDVTVQDDVDSVAEIASSEYGRVDSLHNVAGVLGDAGVTTPGPERNLSMLDRDWLRSQMEVNVVGPMMLTRGLAPLMRSKKGRKVGRAETVVVNVSARVGSIADNVGGLGWHSYRMSKAALNQGTRTISHELKRQGTWSVALYPGFTETDMSEPFRKGAKVGGVFPVDFTVNRLLDVVDGMEEKHSGGFYDWAGRALPF